MSNMTSVFARFGKSLDIATRKKIVHAFITPHFTYCLPVWGNSGPGSFSAMDPVIKRTTRVILNNREATSNKTTTQLTGINSFRPSPFYRNVCRLFSFKQDDLLYYYANVNTLSVDSSYYT